MAPRRSRDWTRTINTEVEIDLDEELSDDDLLALARERGLAVQDVAPPGGPSAGRQSPREWWEDFAEDIRTAAQSRDRMHLDVLLHRMLVAVGCAPLPIPSTTRNEPGRRQ